MRINVMTTMLAGDGGGGCVLIDKKYCFDMIDYCFVMIDDCFDMIDDCFAND